MFKLHSNQKKKKHENKTFNCFLVLGTRDIDMNLAPAEEKFIS